MKSKESLFVQFNRVRAAKFRGTQENGRAFINGIRSIFRALINTSINPRNYRKTIWSAVGNAHLQDLSRCRFCVRDLARLQPQKPGGAAM